MTEIRFIDKTSSGRKITLSESYTDSDDVFDTLGELLTRARIKGEKWAYSRDGNVIFIDSVPSKGE